MSRQSYTAMQSTGLKIPAIGAKQHRALLIGAILLVALVAFELFNFDTTQFALQSLLGNVTFLGLQWATILAVAFCAIDFAGLNRLFTPSQANGQSREALYLMGAWLLGATMNAVMTWWAVSLTLLNNGYGNEVLSREELLRFVPIFVAVLVWLTRILFIGSLSIAGDHLFQATRRSKGASAGRQAPSPRLAQGSSASPARPKPAPKRAAPVQPPAPPPVTPPRPVSPPVPPPSPAMSQTPPPSRPSRVRQRPPVPGSGLRSGRAGIEARPKRS